MNAHRLRFGWRAASLFGLLLGGSVHPQTWDGGGANDDWSSAINWVSDVAPANDGTANIFFGGSTRLTPNVDVVWGINALTFNTGAGPFTLGGNLLTIGAGGLTNLNPANAETINNVIVLGAPQFWSGSAGNLIINGNVVNGGNLLTAGGAASITINGPVNGTAGLVKTNIGTLVFSGGSPNTYTGPTFIQQGLLVLSKTPGVNAIGGPVTIGDGLGGPSADTLRLDSSDQIVNSATITINDSGQFFLSGTSDTISNLVITGGHVLTTLGGTLTVLNRITANASAQTATVSGNLMFGGGATGFEVADGVAAIDLDVSAIVGAAGGVQVFKINTGTLRLSAANTFPGGLVVNSGTVALGHDLACGTGPLHLQIGTIQADGGPRALTNAVEIQGFPGFAGALDLTLSGNVTLLGGGVILNVSNTALTTLAGAISGAVPSLTKRGPGTLRLAGSSANPYSGPTTVEEGILRLSKPAGTIAIAGSLTIGDGVGGPGSDGVQLDNANQIADNASLTVNQSGLLNLSSSVETIGSLTMSGGRVSSSPFGGGLTLGGNVTGNASATSALIDGLFFLGASTHTFTIADGAAAIDMDISARVFGLGISKLGPGTLRLSGINGFAGGVNLGDGTLAVGNDFALGTGALNFTNGAVAADGGARVITNALNLQHILPTHTNRFIGSNDLSFTGPITLSGNEHLQVRVENTGLTTFAGRINDPFQGGYNLIKSGLGTLVFGGSSANTYPGDTRVNEGTLVLNKSVADGASRGQFYIGDDVGGANADVVRLDANDQIAIVRVNIASSGLLNLNGFSDTIGDLVMTAGNVETGSGSLGIVSRVATFPSVATASINGRLDLRSDFQSDARSFDISDGSAAIDLDIPALVSNGRINKQGLGTLRLSGANTFAGGLQVGEGTLAVGSDGTLGTGMLTIFGGTIQANGGPRTVTNASTFAGSTRFAGALDLNFAGPMTLNGAPTLTVDNTGATTLSGPIGGDGLIKAGTNTLVFSGAAANTYLGGTIVNAGTLALSKSVPDGAIRGGLTIGDDAGGANADVVRLDANDQITNTAIVTVRSSGLLNLNGFSETIGPLTLIGGSVSSGVGTLTLGGDVTGGASASSAVISGNLNLGGAARTFNVANGAAAIDVDVSAVIADGNLRKTGAGALRLSGANTFAGGLSLNDGTLLIGNDTAAGTGPLSLLVGTLQADGTARTLANPVTLSSNAIVDGAVDLAFSSAVSGNGGLTKNGAGTLTFSAPSTVGGPLVLNAGGLTAGALTSSGSFTHNGGAFNGVLNNRGMFTYNGGMFNGRLVNEGSAVFNANFTAGNGLANFANLSVASGRTLAFNGAGLDNQGNISLAGGELSGSGPLVNNSFLSGHGTISGSGGFINNVLVQQSGGNLTLNNTGANANFGNMDLAAGFQFRLNGGALNNSGTINLNGGAVAGTANLNNETGGTIAGRGSISSPFQNDGGVVLVEAGTLNIVPAFANSGVIQLTDFAANLTGGTVTNTGTIEGHGNVGNGVLNQGVIEARDGTLTLSGPVSNQTNGLIAAASGNKVLAAAGLALQSGVLNLSGGTFDNNGRPLNNTGQISGHGAFRTGGLENNGSAVFTGGNTTVNGNVANQAGRVIEVAYNPAIFTGNVVNNGVFKVTDTTVKFTGTYTENGMFVSDPATSFFATLIVGPNGSLLGGSADEFYVANDFRNGSTQSNAWETADSELTFRGSATHLFLLAGAELGPTYAGYLDNFAWGAVRVAAGESLTLGDGNGASGAALYTEVLVLQGGLGQVGSITGNGFNIYYDPTDPANAYLNQGTYPLAGGGEIKPVTPPTLRIVSIARLSGGTVRLDCEGVPSRAHQIQASTDLNSPTDWATIGTVSASASGTFTFDHANAPNFSARFYRLRLP